MAGASIFSKLSGMLKGGGSTAVGLSIGSSSIKLVELKKTGQTWKLLHFGIVQLPEDVVVNREIVNQIAVVENLKTLLSQVKLSSRQICTAISGTSVIIKRMNLEVPKAKDIQNQVFWEAEQYLPFDISEVVMDYHILSREKDGKTSALLVAAKKTLIDTLMATIQEAGLQPKLIDLDLFALQNVFEANLPSATNDAVALVEIGASATKVVITQAGIPVFTKDSAIGGRNLTAEIQRQLNLSYADAETLKMEGQGETAPQEVAQLVQNMAENFATEIKRSIDFYAASTPGGPISSILLAGGSAKIPNLTRVIEDVTHLPTQILNPFVSISYDQAVFSQEYLNNIAPIAAVPIGLALRAGAE